MEVQKNDILYKIQEEADSSSDEDAEPKLMANLRQARDLVGLSGLSSDKTILNPLQKSNLPRLSDSKQTDSLYEKTTRTSSLNHIDEMMSILKYKDLSDSEDDSDEFNQGLKEKYAHFYLDEEDDEQDYEIDMLKIQNLLKTESSKDQDAESYL